MKVSVKEHTEDCVYKDAVRSLERANNRLSIIVIILICLLVISNAMWFQYEQSFADETTVYETVYEVANDS